MKTPAGMPLAAPHATSDRRPDRIVLVLQGGGALGAYQVGVYEALHEAGIEPDWIIGTSIGAINASLIAGNRREDRLARLDDFWRRVAYGPGQRLAHGLPFGGAQLATWMTIAAGVDAFFAPNILAFAGPQHPLGADRAGYYSTDMLRKTLGELVDFDLINRGGCRLTVGAANVRTAQMHYFDSRDMPFEASHIMASGALPPAFPPVRIGGDLYWDGGILSNTPVEAVFDDNPRRSSLIFAVHLWNPHGPEPATMAEVANRQKDVQYASRAHSPYREAAADPSSAPYRGRTRGAAAEGGARDRRGSRTRRLRLSHPDACGAAAGADARRREPVQGRRLQSRRHRRAATVGL